MIAMALTIHKQTHQCKLGACSSVQWALISSKRVCSNFTSSPAPTNLVYFSSAGFSSRPTSRILVTETGRDIPVLSHPVPGFSNNCSILHKLGFHIHSQWDKKVVLFSNLPLFFVHSQEYPE